jgi:hypothetical protein
MTTSQAIITTALMIIGLVGTIVGLIAFVNAEHNLLRGSLMSKVYSDDDLRPHPRYRHHTSM